MIELLKHKYKFIKKIGQGGMAEIYLALDRSTNEQVAIKFLRPDQKDNIVMKKRFLNELNTSKKVNSPYVVKVIDGSWTENNQYITMEYIEGDVLANYISKRTRLTIDEVVDYTKQIALGFEEIHRSGIVHRDIKASNMMITAHGQIKIIDFGIAINDDSISLTKTDNIIGSVQYIAPELVDQEKATVRSDIYALGVLMFEMLTGSLPFRGKDSIDTARKHGTQKVPHVNKIFSNIPQSVANVVIKATARDPKKRYASMYGLYKDISTVLDKSRIFEEVYELDKKQKRSWISIFNSKWTLVVIVGILFILLLTLVIIIVLNAFA